MKACPRVVSWGAKSRGKRLLGVRFGSWNVGTLTGRSIELVKILQKRKVNITCLQETKWTGSKTRGG